MFHLCNAPLPLLCVFLIYVCIYEFVFAFEIWNSCLSNRMKKTENENKSVGQINQLPWYLNKHIKILEQETIKKQAKMGF